MAFQPSFLLAPSGSKSLRPLIFGYVLQQRSNSRTQKIQCYRLPVWNFLNVHQINADLAMQIDRCDRHTVVMADRKPRFAHFAQQQPRCRPWLANHADRLRRQPEFLPQHLPHMVTNPPAGVFASCTGRVTGTDQPNTVCQPFKHFVHDPARRGSRPND